MNPMKMLDDMRTIKQLLTDAERNARGMGEEEPGAEHRAPAALRARLAGRQRCPAAIAGLDRGTMPRVLERLGVDRGLLAEAARAELAVVTSGPAVR